MRKFAENVGITVIILWMLNAAKRFNNKKRARKFDSHWDAVDANFGEKTRLIP